ncbi:MAG: (4Fe-4S)-binding protein, partial [Bacteroidetes bacterium]|nr:(4Fe-4S)-binding protein [Bacteroidota bacterium]
MEKKIIKEYKNDDITVFWKAHKCIHSANCVKGLKE